MSAVSVLSLEGRGFVGRRFGGTVSVQQCGAVVSVAELVLGQLLSATRHSAMNGLTACDSGGRGMANSLGSQKLSAWAGWR